MPNVNFVGGERGSEERIRQFEGKLGERLPPDYRNYLLEQNGAVPLLDNNKCTLVRVDWQGKAPESTGHAAILQDFYKLSDAPSSRDLSTCHATFHDRIPDDTIAIGADPGGNLFLVGIKGENCGKILFWSRDIRPVRAAGEAPNHDNVGLIAETFSEFLSKLEIEPDDWDAWETKSK